MKKELLPSILLTIICIIFFSVIYPFIVWGIGQIAPNKGKGFVVTTGAKPYYTNIAQKFTVDKYFWPRPSAVDYNAAGSGGSNKGPAEPSYLNIVQERIDSFMAHNPGIKKSDIPSDMVTASGSGLDPDISVEGANVQANRVARARNLPVQAIATLIRQQTEKPLFGIFGPERINVLKINIALDALK